MTTPGQGPKLYAEHASDRFNAWMEQQCRAIDQAAREALGDGLLALVLGGGYARGEGGVLRGPDGSEKPYNDLDFTTVVRRKDKGIAARLAPISHRFEEVLGIDVDFSRPLTEEDIRQWPHWLMWTDMLAAHRVLSGPQDILRRNAPPALRGQPPLIEATRLLLNRGAGLLWALRIARGVEEARDPDFVRRNLRKCELAVGDAALLANRRHQTLYRGRDRILESVLADDPDAARYADLHAYREALAFRLEPGLPPDPQPGEDEILLLAERWTAALLAVESRRAGRAFTTTREYCAWDGLREPELHRPILRAKNAVLNLRLGAASLRYPRERLYRQLPMLLAGRGGQWEAESAEFLRVWGRFN